MQSWLTFSRIFAARTGRRRAHGGGRARSSGVRGDAEGNQESARLQRERQRECRRRHEGRETSLSLPGSGARTCYARPERHSGFGLASSTDTNGAAVHGDLRQSADARRAGVEPNGPQRSRRACTGVVYAIKDPRFCRSHPNKSSLRQRPTGACVPIEGEQRLFRGILSAAEDPKGSAGT